MNKGVLNVINTIKSMGHSLVASVEQELPVDMLCQYISAVSQVLGVEFDYALHANCLISMVDSSVAYKALVDLDPALSISQLSPTGSYIMKADIWGQPAMSVFETRQRQAFALYKKAQTTLGLTE